jgi:hypothetical protein
VTIRGNWKELKYRLSCRQVVDRREPRVAQGGGTLLR